MFKCPETKCQTSIGYFRSVRPMIDQYEVQEVNKYSRVKMLIKQLEILNKFLSYTPAILMLVCYGGQLEPHCDHI